MGSRLEARTAEEGGLLGAAERGNLGFEDRRHPADPGPWPRPDFPEPVLLPHPRPIGERFLVEVQAVEDRLLGEEREPPDRLGLFWRERHGAERDLGLEVSLQASQDLLLPRLDLLPLLPRSRREPLGPPV